MQKFSKVGWITIFRVFFYMFKKGLVTKNIAARLKNILSKILGKYAICCLDLQVNVYYKNICFEVF